MQSNVIFKGLTRPAMLFGIPITPLVVVGGGITLIATWTTWWLLLALIPILLVMHLMTKEDDFIFNLSFLQLKFMTSKASQNYYGTKTFSANSYREIPKKVDLPDLSVFGLDKNPSFEKYIPYSSVLADDITITKDFILLTTWKVDGVAFDIEHEDDIDHDKNSLNMLFKAHSSKSISFYTHTARHTIQDNFSPKYNNEFLQDLSDQYYNGFKNGDLKSNSLYITVAFNPFSGKVEKSDFIKMNYATKKNEIKHHIKKMRDTTDVIEANLKKFKAKRLGVYEENGKKYNSQLEFFSFLMSGEESKIRSVSAPIYEYLTGGLQNLQFNKSMMQLNFTNGKRKFARGIELKEYGTDTYSGILDALMYSDIDYTITQSFSSLPRAEARDKLTRQKKQLISSEDDGLTQIEQIDHALDDLSSGLLGFGKYHFSLMIYGESVKEVKEKTNEILTTLTDVGFTGTVAEIALPATYFSQFPGNFALRPRVSLISSQNYAGLVALHNFPKGKRDNNCWGEAAAILKTPNHQPYYLNLHETHSNNDFGKFHLGNTLVIGKSGGGKTAFLTFLMNSMMKYADPHTFPKEYDDSKKNEIAIYLDKDKGAMGNILAAGGEYLSVESSKPSGFNPFMCDATPSNIRNLQNLTKLLVTRNHEVLTSNDEKKLTDAINFIMNEFERHERQYPITLLLENITDSADSLNSLKDRLTIWKKGNKLGWVFDNEKDLLDFDYSETNIYGIDGTEFLDDEEVKSVMSYYILWRVMDLMDGRRLGIFIDETWKWIEEDLISDEVKNKLKTNRKLNSFFVLVVQSVEDFLKNKNARAIIEQSATRIFFTNPQAVEEDYVKGLNCTKEEYETIKNIDPSTYQFLINKHGERVMATLDLSSVDEEIINILSTGKAYVDSIEEIFSDKSKSYQTKLNELKTLYKG